MIKFKMVTVRDDCWNSTKATPLISDSKTTEG